ncbi:hypothetical protein [Gimesia fumaroli]|uniref:hypothetical protein n=1 Tax=Gimesia fumaroli TaxID=2527976 RepID=UPI0011A931BB|nr:hypothetical protein [Gimesia fumaroli]
MINVCDQQIELLGREVKTLPGSMNGMELPDRFSESADDPVLLLQIVKMNLGPFWNVFIIILLLRRFG